MLDFVVIILVVCIIAQWIQSKPFYWKKAGIPYSIPLPVFGSTAKVFFKPFYEVFEELYKKMGDNPVYGFHFSGKPALIVSDPKVLKRIMVSDSDCFMGRGMYTNPKIDPVGKGVFFVDGEEWRKVRSKLTPYFTPARIKGMLQIINPTSEMYVKRITESCSAGPVDVQDISMRYAIDVVMSNVFGLQPECLENNDSFFYRLQKEMVGFMVGVKFMIGDISPGLYGFLGLTFLSNKSTNQLKKFIKEVLKQRLDGIGHRYDFLQGMIELMKSEENNDFKDKEQFNSDGTPVARFDEFTVTGQCMVMFIAGTETTGLTLSFLLYELALNTEIQDKAREEINSMISTTKNSYSYEELLGLKYIRMLFLETLRKYPIVTTYLRQCTRSIKINDVHIPVGTKIIIAPYAMHKNTKYFPQPDKFIPERFEDETKIIPGSYVPYGMGPRTCIGIKMAEIEIALALSKLLPKVKLFVSSKTQIPLALSKGPSLSSKNGVWLRAEEI